MSYAYAPTDIYWGQLSGCLEALNAGTTTVLDHSHAVYTPEHGKHAGNWSMRLYFLQTLHC
jgi:cytosine/adenosine deaminase-related metal-dependent hydrolase